MARRYYPTWLPPNPRERHALLSLRRRQIGVIVWLAGLAPVGWIAAALTRSDSLFVPLTIFWLLVGVMLSQRAVATPCPRCGEKFCQRQELPYWYGLFTRRCDNCGLSLDPNRKA